MGDNKGSQRKGIRAMTLGTTVKLLLAIIIVIFIVTALWLRMWTSQPTVSASHTALWTGETMPPALANLGWHSSRDIGRRREFLLTGEGSRQYIQPNG